MRPLVMLCTVDKRAARILPGLMSSRVVGGAEDQVDIWRELATHACDLVVVDRRLLGPRPEDRVRELLDLPGGASLVVLIREEESTARASLLVAGSSAVLSRETPFEELALALDALAMRAAQSRRDSLIPYSKIAPELATMNSKSPRMRAFLDLVRKVAPSDSSVLLLGETGVGKEYLARAIHSAGSRRGGPFVPVHCAALSESLLESELFGHVEGAFTGALHYRRGVFELAHKGTIFLDEMGELSPQLQVKLLRVIQERSFQPVGGEETIEVDVRIIAATNRNLALEMSNNRFRADLYYRLSVVTFEIPPLRERSEDIPDLVSALIAKDEMARKRGVTGVHDAGLAAMLSYSWPGNIRELMNVIERAALLSSNTELLPEDLPFVTGGDTPESGALGAGALVDASLFDEKYTDAREHLVNEFEREYLDRALKSQNGHLMRTATATGLNPRTLYAKMRTHGQRKEHYRQGRDEVRTP